MTDIAWIDAALTSARAQALGALLRYFPNIPGKSLVAVVVDYAPGAKSASHHHADSAII